MTTRWSGRWYKLGPTVHAERLGSNPPATLCGRKLHRDARPINLELADDICDACWGATA